MSRNKDLSQSSSLRTKKKDSVERKVINIPILDGKTTEERSVDDEATDYIHRIRSKFDHDNKQDLPVLDGNTTKERSVDDDSRDYIHRMRSKFDHENKLELHDDVGNSNSKVSNMKHEKPRAENLKAKDPKGKNSRSSGTKERSVDDDTRDYIHRMRSKFDHENKLELHDDVGNSNSKVSNMKHEKPRAENLKAKYPKGKNSRSSGTSKSSKGANEDDLSVKIPKMKIVARKNSGK